MPTLRKKDNPRRKDNQESLSDLWNELEALRKLEDLGEEEIEKRIKQEDIEERIKEEERKRKEPPIRDNSKEPFRLIPPPLRIALISYQDCWEDSDEEYFDVDNNFVGQMDRRGRIKDSHGRLVGEYISKGHFRAKVPYKGKQLAYWVDEGGHVSDSEENFVGVIEDRAFRDHTDHLICRITYAEEIWGSANQNLYRVQQY